MASSPASGVSAAGGEWSVDSHSPSQLSAWGRVAWFLVSPLKHTSQVELFSWGHLPETTQVEKEPLVSLDDPSV